MPKPEPSLTQRCHSVSAAEEALQIELSIYALLKSTVPSNDARSDTLVLSTHLE